MPDYVPRYITDWLTEAVRVSQSKFGGHPQRQAHLFSSIGQCHASSAPHKTQQGHQCGCNFEKCSGW